MANDYGISSEWLDWYALSPQERWEQSGLLWDTFFALGGNFAPEPDTQSPFFDEKSWRSQPVDGRPSVRVLRSGGV
jgi:hypothetical protein